MKLVVLLMGVLIGSIGIRGVIHPSWMMHLVAKLEPRKRLYVAVGARLVFGVILIVAAPECRLPTTILVLGIIALVAAVVLPFVGTDKLDQFVRWLAGKPDPVIRTWASVAIAFGLVLVYAGT